MRNRLNTEFPEVEFAFDTGGILTAALNMGEPSPIHLQVEGYQLPTAHRIADELVTTIKGVEGATDVRVAQRIDYPMIRVEIDRLKAIDVGVDPEQVMKSLVSATNSSINFDPAFWIDPRNGNHYFLGTQYFESEINSLDSLRYVRIKGTQGNVYLMDVAKIVTNVQGPSVINHRNIKRVTDTFANILPGYDLGTVVRNIERKLTDPEHVLALFPRRDTRSAASKYPDWLQNVLARIGLNNPTKYGIGGDSFKGFSLEVQGEIRSMRDSFVDFALGLVLATVLVYLVMVGQFRSFVDAAIVRFRPILMTSITMILALTLMAVGFAGGEADVPLARTIVGGVIAATLLPKFVVPCLYVMIKRKSKPVTVETGWA